MPRAYRLGRRADHHAATRARIVSAALDIYREHGFAGASTRAVATAADVAPATVRNHFPTALDLAAAAGETVLADLRPPSAGMFQSLDTVAERVERLARELIAFFDRADPWWSIQRQDPELAQAWTGVSETYDRAFAELLRGALGPLGDDPIAMAVTGTLVGPPLHYALRSVGQVSGDAVDIQLGVLIPWLESRLAKVRDAPSVRGANRTFVPPSADGPAGQS